MSSLFKKLRRRKKRKQSHEAARGSSQYNEIEVDDIYSHRGLSQKKKALIRSGVTIAAVVAIVAGVFLFIQRRSYGDYKVVTRSEQEDTVSTKYMDMNGKVFRYSTTGASLVDTSQDTLWSSTYEMETPVADICNDTAVVYDQGGTSMVVFDKDGERGTISASYNIVKARVAGQGVVAAILDGGEDTWVNFYAKDGSLIAENQTRVDDPGYPLDIAVSEDGLIIMVAYQFVDGGTTTSYVAFYNFGTAGQNQIDNIVSGYEYEGVVVPQTAYLKDDVSVAFKDNGFVIYEGRQIPKESANVEVEEEIVSTFYDESHIGLVFRDDGKDKMYTMKVYNTSGKELFQKSFNIPYTEIKMSGGQVVMYNASQICVISMQGVEKFNGTVDEGSINDFFKIGWNKYVLVLDNGVDVIKFK